MPVPVLGVNGFVPILGLGAGDGDGEGKDDDEEGNLCSNGLASILVLQLKLRQLRLHYRSVV